MKRHPQVPRCYVCGAPSEFDRVLVDIQTAKRLARVSEATIYRWMRARMIEWVELPYGQRRIFLDSLFRDPPRPRDGIP